MIELHFATQADCHEAIALQLLLKLKRHLKIMYGLNDARCQVGFFIEFSIRARIWSYTSCSSF